MVENARGVGVGGRPVRLRALVRFFVPLCLTYTVMMFTHLVMNAGLARTPFPELAIAAFSVGLNVVHLFESPALVMRPASIAMARGEREFRVVARVAYIVLGSVTILMAGIAFSPLGRSLFRDVLGVSGPLLEPALAVLKWGVLIPVLSGLRQLYQGVIIYRRETGVLTVAIGLRLVVMLGVISLLLVTGWLQGALIGIVAFMAGVCTEMGTAIWWVRRRRRAWRKQDWAAGRLQRPGSPAPVPDEGEHATAARRGVRARQALRAAEVVSFVLPFLIAGLAEMLYKPSLNAGLARARDAETAIAAFAVAWTVAYLVLNSVRNLHQVVMVFDDQPGGAELTERFCRWTGVVGAALIVILAVSPLGSWFMRVALGIPAALSASVLPVVLIFSLQSLLIGWEQVHTGRFLRRRDTKAVFYGRTINLAFLIGTSALLLGWLR